jgi:hypothetical protein
MLYMTYRYEIYYPRTASTLMTRKWVKSENSVNVLFSLENKYNSTLVYLWSNQPGASKMLQNSHPSDLHLMTTLL